MRGTDRHRERQRETDTERHREREREREKKKKKKENCLTKTLGGKKGLALALELVEGGALPVSLSVSLCLCLCLSLSRLSPSLSRLCLLSLNQHAQHLGERQICLHPWKKKKRLGARTDGRAGGRV